MKMMFDMFPLAVFLVALIMADLKTATAAIIVATIIQNIWFWLRHRRFERMHLITMVAVIVLGGLTLWLNDDRFIKWKPTVVNWVFTVIMFYLQFFTAKSALERMLGGQMKMPSHAWNTLNTAWAVFFFVIGLVNLYVAFVYGTDADPFKAVYGGPIADAEVRDRHWGYFKVIGVMGLTLVFAIVSFVSLGRHIEVDEAANESSEPRADQDRDLPS